MGFFGDKYVKQEGLIGLRPIVLGFTGILMLITHLIQAEGEKGTSAAPSAFSFASVSFNEAPARWLFHRYLDVELVGRSAEAVQPPPLPSGRPSRSRQGMQAVTSEA